MPISWSLDDFPHFEFLRAQGLMATYGVFQNWVDDFDYMTARPSGASYLYLPSLVIGRGHRMMMLERLIHALIERGAVFPTMEEAAREIRQAGEAVSLALTPSEPHSP